MSVQWMRRAGAAATVTTLCAAGLIAPSSGATAAASDQTRAVVVSGTVRLIAGEDDADRYWLETDAGPTVQLGGGFAAEPNSRFNGTLVLPVATSTAEGRSAARSALREVSRAGGAARVAPGARLAPPAPAPGPTAHVTYVAAAQNLGPHPLTNAQSLSMIGAAQNYWVRESEGQIASWPAPTEVRGFTTTSSVAAGCGLGAGGADFQKVFTEAATQAFPGVDFSGNAPNHLVVLVPDPCGGTVAGRARVGTSFASGGPAIVETNTDLDWLAGTFRHEFGHTLSLRHAATSTHEYGNSYEVMGAVGGTQPMLGAAYRDQQGILSLAEQVNITNQSTAATINSRSSVGVRAAKFIDPDNGQPCYVEYRDGLGNDVGSRYAAGYTAPAYGNQSYRRGVTITCREATSDRMVLQRAASGQVGMLAGDTWQNGSGTFRIAVTGVGAGASFSSAYTPGAPLVGSASLNMRPALEPASALVSRSTYTFPTTSLQWFVNGQLMETTDGLYGTFKPPLEAAGQQLEVRSSLAYAPGRAPTAFSAVATVPAATLTAAYGRTGSPGITGKKRKGKRLGVRPMVVTNVLGAAPSGAVRSYQWKRNGRVVSTEPTYKPRRRDVGKRLTVSEMVSAPGHVTTAWRSSLSVKIKPAKGKKGQGKGKEGKGKGKGKKGKGKGRNR